MTTMMMNHRVYRAAGWKVQKCAKTALRAAEHKARIAGNKAKLALVSTIIDSDDVVDQIAVHLFHAPHDQTMHLTLKFVLAFLAVL